MTLSSLHFLSSPIRIPPNLEAGSGRSGCRKPGGSPGLPPWPRDVIVISYSEPEPAESCPRSGSWVSSALSLEGQVRSEDDVDSRNDSAGDFAVTKQQKINPAPVRGAEPGAPQVSFPVFFSDSLPDYPWVPSTCWARDQRDPQLASTPPPPRLKQDTQITRWWKLGGGREGAQETRVVG